jgi:hypothetical protein
MSSGLRREKKRKIGGGGFKDRKRERCEEQRE